MILVDLINYVMKRQGNLERGNGIYISTQNMDYFAAKLASIDARQGILITPYLIIKDGSLYELHYYEFDIEVRADKSHFNDYNHKNTLAKEITQNLKPQAIVANGDTNFYHKSVKWYLENMKKMTFDEIVIHYPELKNAQLFYQIFINSDLN